MIPYFRLTLVLALVGTDAVIACNDAPLIKPADCHPDHCTCEDDPLQGQCSGFNGQPGGGDASTDVASNDPDAADASDSAWVDDGARDGDAGDGGD